MAQQSSRLQPVGNLQLDALLGGGLPLGAVCEVTGPEGSGRSSIALSLLAQVSREAACAYVDVSDTLSPHSAAAAGVCLEHLLWVRLAAPMLSQSTDLKPGTSTLPEAYGRPRETGQGYGCGPHPRMETKGVAPALEYMLFAREERRHRKMEGTPGYPNQPLGLTTASQGPDRVGALQSAQGGRDRPTTAARPTGGGGCPAARLATLDSSLYETS